MSYEARVLELGLTIPDAPKPVAAYVPTVITGDLIHVSGQVPIRDGGLGALGLVGQDVDEQTAVAEARICAINILSQLKAALGSLDRVQRIVKLGVFVASAPGFASQPMVANGASELMVEVFGEAGKHARSAVGVAMLPLNVPVEVDAIVQIKA